MYMYKIPKNTCTCLGTMSIDLYMYMYYNIDIKGTQKGATQMKKITNIRKSVCIMANELKKAGYTLSQAFKKAWRRVKLQMTIRAAGTTFENRQERLEFLKRFPVENLKVTLKREEGNPFDRNAIQIIVHIPEINRRTVIGYVPRKLARELSRVIDAGVRVEAKLLEIIGGYSFKESLGALIKITI